MRLNSIHTWLCAFYLALALPLVQALGHVHGIDHHEHIEQAEHGDHHTDTLHLCLLVDGLAGAQSLVSAPPAVCPALHSAPLRLVLPHTLAHIQNPHILRTRVRDPPALT
ncbi:MAG TPA: hypothetical protein VFV43_07175 [Limnobacter sp.]|nr:hypothetical protein [Limnobacter sp.]